MNLYDLHKETERLIDQGDGFRQVKIWQERTQSYTPIKDGWTVPDLFDEALADKTVDKNQDVLLK